MARTCSVFTELSSGSIGNGIRFHSEGYMLVADYTNHNVLKIHLDNRKIEIYAHEPAMNQPNDLAIGVNDLVYASDPNWAQGTGQIWRIDHQGQVDLLETGMGTTNGIEISPDERTLYVNESMQRNVWAYDLSTTGEISSKRLLIQFPDFTACAATSTAISISLVMAAVLSPNSLQKATFCSKSN